MRYPNAARALSLLGLGALLGGPAQAECRTAYTGSQLVADLSQLTVALRALEEVKFLEAGTRLTDNLICSKEQVPVGVFASSYRFIGATHFLQGNEDKARAWFRVALELDPSFEWDLSELDINHPMRRVFDDERQNALVDAVEAEGKTLIQPAGAALFLDGRPLRAPELRPDRPHVIQVIGTDKTVRQTFLIEDGKIPERFLSDPNAGGYAEIKKKKKRKSKTEDDAEAQADAEDETGKDLYGVEVVERVRPVIKTPLMISGAVVMVGGGVIYGFSFASRSEFDRASTSDELNKYRTLTNTLVVASGLTVFIGAGVGTAGLLLDGGTPGLFWTMPL